MLYAFREESDLSEDTTLKIACGLGGGMGRNQEVCGAVSGGILVLGTRHGRGSNDDRSVMRFTYQKTREFMDEFAKRHGTWLCRRLVHGCDLTTEEGLKYFKDNDLLSKVCTPCVRSAVEIVDHIG